MGVGEWECIQKPRDGASGLGYSRCFLDEGHALCGCLEQTRTGGVALEDDFLERVCWGPVLHFVLRIVYKSRDQRSI